MSGRSVIGYGGGEFIAKGLNFLLMLLLPFLFSKDEYGRIALLLAFEALAFGVISGGGPPNLSRLYARFKTSRPKIVRPALRGWFRQAFPIAVLTLFLGFAFESVAASRPHSFGEYLIFTLYVFLSALRENVFCLLRVDERLSEYFSLKVSAAMWRLVLAVALSFAVPTSLSFIVASVLAIGLGSFSASHVFFELRRLPSRKREAVSGAMQRLGRPLLITSIVSVVSLYFDRYMIEWFLDTKEVATYSFAATLAASPFFFLSVIGLALIPQFYAFKGYDVAARRYLWGVTGLSLAVVIIGSLAIFAAYLWLTTVYLQAYQAEAIVMLLLLLKGCFVPLSLHIRYVLVLSHRTSVLLAPALIACVVTIVTNLLLVPSWGILGAAIGALVGEFVFITTAFYCARKALL